MTKNELVKMSEVDIHTVNRDELVDINTVKIDTTLPVKERMEDYIKQIKNPYCYLDNGTIVKITFSGKKSLEDCLKIATLPDLNSIV